MIINFLSLNSWKGKFIDETIRHIQTEKYDLVNLQEVAGGTHSYKNKDNFAAYKKTLGLNSVLAIRGHNTDSEKSYFGNATFYSKKFTLHKKEVVWMQKNIQAIEMGVTDPIEYPYNILSLLLGFGGEKFYLINTHLIWEATPKESKRRIKVNQALVDYVKKLEYPFILSGDFNINKDNPTIDKLDQLGANLLKANQVDNTLNLRLHKAKDRIPAPGLAVDFIYTSHHFQQKSFEVLKNLNLSDHFGVTVRLSF